MYSVYYYGGAYFLGSNRDRIIQPEIFATEHDIIVVVPNYRLTGFGFWQLEEGDIRTNWGILDAQLSLEWAFNNIENFGGDASDITD